ncbi:hypothetical protein [Lysobacter sp. Root604]|uniref:hypothetical protein n=1 Tax=Lysobacter sp. Root604 TaxID=1736568 RepID=UPI000701C3E7|nr:hypothetical protein [Lysobacter sp. Root604]KRA14682.1 hypothetical protein ASD69_20335 [Lysobacter sp. Root604]
MSKRIGKFAIAAVLLFTAGAALATEVFDVWGYGISPGAARDDAFSLGRQLCIGNGYFGASVEEVQTYQSGGGYITYGIAQCY